ncbi:MAG TPA: HAD family hydrolase [Tepidisphaeraceae bacterium]|nr:HAD family hydrolase [Tepidisphaeraceae bacterium]
MMLPKAILFDMDGTLTQPYMDYDRIKRDMGVGPGPILESLAAMEPQQRHAAEAILHQHEDAAASASTLNPGCVELLTWLREIGLETALVTRNSRRSVRTVFDLHGLHFDVCVTREDGKFKPDPAPLLLACQRLGVEPDKTWMVGDSYHDIDAGIAAKIRTVWVSHGKAKAFASEPWRTVRDLLELTQVLKACLK